MTVVAPFAEGAVLGDVGVEAFAVDVVTVHVVDGERQRQHFEPVRDADEFVDVQ